MNLIEALILTGGQDSSPSLYHEELTEKLGPELLVRDLSEQALIRETLKQEKPILAIYRGM